MTVTFAPFDIADYLDSEEVIVKYLAAVVEDPNPDVFIAALGDVSEACRRLGENARKISPAGL